MRDYLPGEAAGNTATLEAPDAATVGDVADLLRAPRRLVHAVLVNDAPGNLDTPLADGDRLTLMPHYSGGRT